jgi:hypothetical protein
MAQKKSFIPGGDAEYDAFFKNVVTYTLKQRLVQPPRWDHIPEAEITALGDACSAWDAAYAAVRKPHTPAVVSFAVLDHIPKDEKELTRTELATRTPHLLRFTEEERGKTVYVAMQWQNESGERGDFTDIQSAIVP